MKKLFVLISVIAVIVIGCVSFSASADDGTVVIDNVVYTLRENKTYGQHYAVTDFFEDEEAAKEAVKVTITDDIDGIKVKGIDTNFTHCEDFPAYEYKEEYPHIKTISIPATVEYIGAYAFTFFPGVEEILLPAGLISIGEGSFYSMDSLKRITIPKGIKHLSFYAFSNCVNLEKVIFDGNIKVIGEDAFGGCNKLSSINLPDSLEKIWSGFYGAAFKKIVIPAHTNLLESSFVDCDKLEKIVFEDSRDYKADYIEVSEDNFSGCSSVKGIYIKTIPTEIINISLSYFDFPNLEKIYFAGSEEKWNELTSEPMREALELRGIEVEFYYKHSHSFKQSGKATCKNGGIYTYTCECGDSYKHSVAKDQVKHNYGAWKTTKKATYTATGTKQRTCSVCGKIEKRTLYKLKLDDVKKASYESTIDKVTLSWDAVEGATGYRVYLYDREAGKDNKIASIKGKTTYTVKKLEKGYSYIFEVQPYHKDSKGNVVFAEKTTVYAKTLATAPKNLVAVSEKTGVVKLTWETSGEWVAYDIDFHTSKEELMAGNALEYPKYNREESAVIKNLESGKTYYFKISIDFDTVDGVKETEIVEVTVK